MLRGAACTRIVLGALASLTVLSAVADSASGLTLRGAKANNTIVVHATGVASGSYSIDGGPWVSFAHIRALTIDGLQPGDSSRRDLDQPEAGMASLAVKSTGPVLVHQAILSGVQLTVTSTTDQVTELGPVVLGQAMLTATAASQINLVNPGNLV